MLVSAHLFNFSLVPNLQWCILAFKASLWPCERQGFCVWISVFVDLSICLQWCFYDDADPISIKVVTWYLVQTVVYVVYITVTMSSNIIPIMYMSLSNNSNIILATQHRSSYVKLKKHKIAIMHLAKILHYCDVIMGTIAHQITSLTIVYSTVYSDVDQRKYQSSASLAFVRGIHRGRWIPRTKVQ